MSEIEMRLPKIIWEQIALLPLVADPFIDAVLSHSTIIAC